jgi:hypothetical protein
VLVVVEVVEVVEVDDVGVDGGRVVDGGGLAEGAARGRQPAAAVTTSPPRPYRSILRRVISIIAPASSSWPKPYRPVAERS